MAARDNRFFQAVKGRIALTDCRQSAVFRRQSFQIRLQKKFSRLQFFGYKLIDNPFRWTAFNGYIPDEFFNYNFTGETLSPIELRNVEIIQQLENLMN